MVLRNVPKTFTFEQQRVEINNVAQDLETFVSNAITTNSFTVTPEAASGSGSLTYDDNSGTFTFRPADLTGYLQSESDPTVSTHVKAITQANITSWTDTATTVTNNNVAWNNAAGWGNHALAGYASTAKTFTFTVTGNGQVSVVDPQTSLTGLVGDYTITGNDRRGIVSGTNPTIHINEEDTVIFNVSASGQPFRLMWATGPEHPQFGWDEIGTNSTNNNPATGQGTESGTLTWVSMEQDGLSLYQGGGLYYYQDCAQNFTNNPTTFRWGTLKVFHKDTPEGTGDWLALNDTPHDYTGQAGKITRVNSTENGLEFTDPPISVTDLKTLVAASTDFADFKNRIAALT